MLRQLTVIILAALRVKSQDKTSTWKLNCTGIEPVSQAVNSTFAVTLISQCPDSSDKKYGCEIKYTFIVNYSDKKSKNVPVDVIYGGNTTDRKFADGITIDYNWRTGMGKATLNLNVTSSGEPVNVTVQSQLQKSCTSVKHISSINFIGCQNNSRFSIVPPDAAVAGYMDIGTILCRDGDVLGLAIYSNGTEATQTQCLADTQWKHAQDITCLYPISAKLQVKDDRYYKRVMLYYNQSVENTNQVNMKCSKTYSTQKSQEGTFLLNYNQLVSPNITIHPSLNQENVSCYFANNYTKYFYNSTATYLSTSTLIITFDPIPSNNDSFCSSSNGSIIFYSNPPANESSLILLKGNETIASQITECCGVQYGVRGQMITPPNISTVIGNLTLRANYSGHVTSYNVRPCDSVSTTTETESYSTINGSGIESYSTINGSGTESYSTITRSGTQSYSTINGSGTERYSTINGSGKTDSSVIVVAAASGGVLILVIIGLIFICRWRSSKGKAKSGDDTVENINPLYGTSDDVVLESKSDEQVINPLYGTTQSEIEVYSVVDKKNKKARKAKKNQKTTKGNEDLYASVDKGKGKSKGNRNSGFEADVTEDTTYSVVDKKKRGAQQARGSIATDVDTYAAVGRKNKKTKGAQKTEKSTTAGIDTCAVVDRTNKTVKGTGDDDLHGSTSQNE